MLKSFKLLLIIALFSGKAFAQDKKSVLSSILHERGEVYVSLEKNRIRSFPQIFALPGFDRVDEDSVFLYLTKKDSLFLTHHMEGLNILPPPSMQYQVQMSNTREKVLEGKAYPTYPLYLEIMEYFRDSFPALVTIDTIGHSINGRLLLAARIGQKRSATGKVPVVFFSSTIHGDEPAGYVFMLMLINQVLTSQEQYIKEMLDDLTIIIHPLENPDGCYFTSDSTIFGATRGNANGVDLNRNFPDPQDGNNPDGNDWQQETILMMNYLQKYPPSLSANFHGGAEVVNYPFDTWAVLHADDAWFRFISSEYAGLASSLLPGYMDEFPGGITNGYGWYQINGGRQDYVTYFLRGRETTIELTNRKLIPEGELLDYWDANRGAMLNYLRQGMFGIHGVVSDSVTLAPLSAELIVLDHDTLNSSVFSDSLSGSFFRYLEAGTYRLKVSANGYKDLYTGEIHVDDYERVDLQIKLLPTYVLPEFNTWKIGPNPFSSGLTVYIEASNEGTAYFRLYDVFGNLRLHEFARFPAGYHHFTLHPLLADGIYFLEINFGGEKKILRVVKANTD